jgi:hypothetical protein
MCKVVVQAHRSLAWGIVGAIMLASLLPSNHVPRSRAGGQAEHVSAYAVALLGMASAYPTIPLATVTIRLAALAATLEYLQRFAPGRRSSLVDVGFSAVGILLGCLLFVAGKAGLRLAAQSFSRGDPTQCRAGLLAGPGPPIDRHPLERSSERTMDNRQQTIGRAACQTTKFWLP